MIYRVSGAIKAGRVLQSSDCGPHAGVLWVPEPRRKLQGRFLHITDMHPDPHYRVGSSEKKACHRGKPKEGKAVAGFYGLSYRCVPSVSTWETWKRGVHPP